MVCLFFVFFLVYLRMFEQSGLDKLVDMFIFMTRCLRRDIPESVLMPMFDLETGSVQSNMLSLF